MATFSLMNQSFLFSALTYVRCFNLQTKCLQLAGFLSSWPKFMETLEIASALSQNVLHSLHFVFWYLIIARSVLYYTVLLPFFMSCSCDSPGGVGATWSLSIWHGTEQAQCHAPQVLSVFSVWMCSLIIKLVPTFPLGRKKMHRGNYCITFNISWKFRSRWATNLYGELNTGAHTKPVND